MAFKTTEAEAVTMNAGDLELPGEKEAFALVVPRYNVAGRIESRSSWSS